MQESEEEPTLYEEITIIAKVAEEDQYLISKFKGQTKINVIPGEPAFDPGDWTKPLQTEELRPKVEIEVSKAEAVFPGDLFLPMMEIIGDHYEDSPQCAGHDCTHLYQNPVLLRFLQDAMDEEKREVRRGLAKMLRVEY